MARRSDVKAMARIQQAYELPLASEAGVSPRELWALQEKSHG